MKNTAYYLTPENYTKTLARLEQNIRSGRFVNYTQQKKQEIWKRLCRYARQLGIKVKSSIVAACLAAGLSLATTAAAQTFMVQTGVNNPFTGVDVSYNAAPAFVNLDNDADIDAFIGTKNLYATRIMYFRNTGNITSATFIEITGGGNPLVAETTDYSYCPPVFVDIDGDGDKDVFIGEYGGTITYYRNNGSPTSPNFGLLTGAGNPLNGSFGGPTTHTSAAFVDIDGDGDMDVFINVETRVGGSTIIRYFKNTGLPTAPAFTEQTGAANPFTGLAIPNYSLVPLAFVNIDRDADMDAFIGNADGTIGYYKNTGTAAVPVFAVQSGVNNPLSSIDVGYHAIPAFVDIDADGDMDLFIGAEDGTITYYKNVTAVLPLQLLSFSGSKQPGYNHLQWHTAGEVNTKSFDIERSSDGSHFTKIATINTTGNSNNNYSINDNVVFSGKIFYRLKMLDIDSRFTYSQIIWLSSELSAGITIYPNPVTDILNINTGNIGILKTTAIIFDANGRLMQHILINDNQQQINVQLLARGMYTIKFADGTAQQFMKE